MEKVTAGSVDLGSSVFAVALCDVVRVAFTPGDGQINNQLHDMTVKVK